MLGPKMQRERSCWEHETKRIKKKKKRKKRRGWWKQTAQITAFLPSCLLVKYNRKRKQALGDAKREQKRKPEGKNTGKMVNLVR